jgi:hypothetical protein
MRVGKITPKTNAMFTHLSRIPTDDNFIAATEL